MPFVLRTGKALAASATEILVELNKVSPHSYYTACSQDATPNLIRLRISPDAGVTFGLLAQHEGNPQQVDPVSATVDFSHLSGSGTAAYRLVLGDAVNGDPRRFTRMDMVEESWRIVSEILDAEGTPAAYRTGSWGPAAADALTEGGWYPPSVAGATDNT